LTSVCFSDIFVYFFGVKFTHFNVKAKQKQMLFVHLIYCMFRYLCSNIFVKMVKNVSGVLKNHWLGKS